MGFNLQMNYKSLDLAYYFCIRRKWHGAKLWKISDANRLNYVLDRWTGEGTSNMTPSYTGATANNVFSDYL
jgi:hypothetical protein